MAYAYSQIPDMEMACDYYKHALQAAKDKGNSSPVSSLSSNTVVSTPESKMTNLTIIEAYNVTNILI